MKKRGPTIPIVVEGETWEVPFGFAHDYQQAVALEKAKPGWGLADLLLLIGYAATSEQIARWSFHPRGSERLRGERSSSRIGQSDAHSSAPQLAARALVRSGRKGPSRRRRPDSDRRRGAL